jgi:hypothetical protein
MGRRSVIGAAGGWGRPSVMGPERRRSAAGEALHQHHIHTVTAARGSRTHSERATRELSVLADGTVPPELPHPA